jgi:hypothetical protein
MQVLIFVSVFGLAAYFYNGYGWNQTARYDPIWAFVEPGPNQYSLAIDDFVVDPDAGVNTGDFALVDEEGGHYYSNKAPGTSLLGIPAYFVLYHGARLLGLDPVSVTGVLVNAYLVHLWVTVLPVALSAAFFYGLALTLARNGRRALLLTCVLYAGTLMLPFSTMLWAHTTAAAFAVVALAFFVTPGPRAGFLSGLFVGVAALTDYGAAPLALTFVVAAWIGEGGGRRLRALCLGGLGPLMAFGLYHWALFGSPLRLASSYSPADMVDEGRVFGLLGALDPRALWGLTFSPVRGMFVFMPVLVLSLIAIRYVRLSDRRQLWWLALANMLLALLLNATFNGWWGGASAGPRYQIIVLPFYVLLLTLLPEGRGIRAALYALVFVSFANMFVIAAISPMAPDAFRGSPLLFCYAKLWGVLRIDLGIDPAPVGGALSRGSLHLYPTFLMRDWAITLADPTLERWASFNLGERVLGLRGVASLLPALAWCAALGTWMSRIAAADAPTSSR